MRSAVVRITCAFVITVACLFVSGIMRLGNILAMVTAEVVTFAVENAVEAGRVLGGCVVSYGSLSSTRVLACGSKRGALMLGKTMRPVHCQTFMLAGRLVSLFMPWASLLRDNGFQRWRRFFNIANPQSFQ